MAETDMFDDLDAAASTHENAEAQLRTSFAALWKRTEERLKTRKGVSFSGKNFPLVGVGDPEDGFQIIGHFSFYDGRITFWWLDEMQEALSPDPRGPSFEGILSVDEIPYRWLLRIVEEDQFSAFVRALAVDLRRRANGNAVMVERLTTLAARPSAGMAEEFTKIAQAVGYDRIQSDWRKAQAEANSNADRAITLASKLVEDTGLFVLSRLRVEPPTDRSITSIMKAVGRALALDPSEQANQHMRAMCSGLVTLVQSIGTLRNAHSESHGQSPETKSLGNEHAALAVDAAGVLCTFVMRRLMDQEMAGTKASTSDRKAAVTK